MLSNNTLQIVPRFFLFTLAFVVNSGAATTYLSSGDYVLVKTLTSDQSYVVMF